MAEWLKSIGFMYLDIDAADHPIFVWPASGQTIKLPGTPRGHVWKDNARKEAADIAGVAISNKRDAASIKERQAAERGRAKAEREERNRKALSALRGKELARQNERNRVELQRRVEDRQRELDDIARLMSRRPTGT